MSLPAIEIFRKTANTAFRANPTDASLVKDAFEILEAQKGQLRSYFGLQHEDKETGYVVIAWENLEDHYKLMNDKEVYPRLGEAIKSFFDVSPASKDAMIHVRPTSEPYKAFEAPVTEIALFTLLPGASKEELEQLVDKIAKGVNSDGGSDGLPYAAWGPIVEKDDTLALLIGWESVEAHYDALKAKQEMADTVAKAKTHATIDMVHVPLTKG